MILLSRKNVTTQWEHMAVLKNLGFKSHTAWNHRSTVLRTHIESSPQALGICMGQDENETRVLTNLWPWPYSLHDTRALSRFWEDKAIEDVASRWTPAPPENCRMCREEKTINVVQTQLPLQRGHNKQGVPSFRTTQDRQALALFFHSLWLSLKPPFRSSSSPYGLPFFSSGSSLSRITQGHQMTHCTAAEAREIYFSKERLRLDGMQTCGTANHSRAPNRTWTYKRDRSTIQGCRMNSNGEQSRWVFPNRLQILWEP